MVNRAIETDDLRESSKKFKNKKKDDESDFDESDFYFKNTICLAKSFLTNYFLFEES